MKNLYESLLRRSVIVRHLKNIRISTLGQRAGRLWNMHFIAPVKGD